MKKQLFAASLALAFAGSASAQLPTDALSGLAGDNGVTGALTALVPVGIISDSSGNFVDALPITTLFSTLSQVATTVPVTALNGSGLPLLSEPAPGQGQLGDLLGGLPRIGGVSGTVAGVTVDGLLQTVSNRLNGLDGFVLSPEFVSDLVPGGLLDAVGSGESTLTGVLLGPLGGSDNGGLPDVAGLFDITNLLGDGGNNNGGLPDLAGLLDVTDLLGGGGGNNGGLLILGSLSDGGLPLEALDATTLTSLLNGLTLSGL